MANMAHCRFENTYKDLQDCYEVLINAQSIDDLIDNSNQYEKEYIIKLLFLCKAIYQEYEDEMYYLED